MTKPAVLFLALVFSAFWPPAIANTEIINFVATEDGDAHIPLAANWPVLNATHNEGQWRVLPAPLHTALPAVCEPPAGAHACPHELWLALDPAAARWARHARFTLRLSWPASAPADFLVEVLDPRAVRARQIGAPAGARPRPPTRRKYARIRAVDAGVRTPSHGPAGPADPVPFVVVLEPVYLGAIPASVVPTLLCLVLAAGLAGLAVPWITRRLEGVARMAREDVLRDGGRRKAA